MYFVNDTPSLDVDTVHAEFRSNRPGARLESQCHLTHFDFFRTDCMSYIASLTVEHILLAIWCHLERRVSRWPVAAIVPLLLTSGCGIILNKCSKFNYPCFFGHAPELDHLKYALWIHH